MRTLVLALGLTLVSGLAAAQEPDPRPRRPIAEAPQAPQAEQPAVAAGDTVEGTVVVTGKPLVVEGVILGDAVALGGDIIVGSAGLVRGTATAFGGRVRAPAGRVQGSIRQIGVPSDEPRRARADGPPSTVRSLKVVAAWFAVLAAIGIGVLLFAEGSLGGVTETLERHFGRSFWYGFIAQLALLPSLLLLCAALALTVVGVLLIPFAVVAYVIAAVGLLTLGFLAVARFTGSAFRRGTQAATRGQHLGALLRGLSVYLAVWLVAAAFTWQPLTGAVLRSIALAVTWVAATLGLGAAIASRVDARRSATRRQMPAMDPMVWQTPTPVTGVAAARRARKTVSEAS